MSEVDQLIHNLVAVEKLLIKSRDTSKANEERAKVFKRFLEEFQENREESLAHVLRKLAAFLPSKVYDRSGYAKKKWLTTEEQIEVQINWLIRSHIDDLIGQALMIPSEEELQDLATFVENRALLHATTFDVSNTIHVNELLSGMQLIVQFYKKSVNSRVVLDFVNDRVLPHFDKLPEDRKLDFLRAWAEISFFTRVPVSNNTLRSMVEILKMYMPNSKPSVFEEEKSSTHVECLLYVFHHMAHKAENAKTAAGLCNRLRESLVNVRLMTSRRIKELRIDLINDEKAVQRMILEQKFLAEMWKEKTVNELRSCINIRGMTEVLLAREISFTGDQSVNLSWKEARKHALVTEITNTKYPRVPDRREKVKNSLSKEWLEDLNDGVLCNLTKSEALSLGALKESQIGRGDGEFRLHGYAKICMLFWKMSEKEIRKVAEVVNTLNKFTGAIRDQEYHFLCGAYVATDLVSSLRYIHKLDDENIPLCTWYLCAHTDSKALGKDPRAIEVGHHCYGSSIENFLLHIQAHGAPTEIFCNFDCKNYRPPTAEDPWRSLRKIKSVKRIPTLKEAVRELRNWRPIGADLLNYSGLFELENGIYYGPLPKYSNFLAYHAVFIEAIKEMNGELVAVCRLSNGVDTGDKGYVYVSLATLYFPVSVDSVYQGHVRGLSQPSHLLSNFVTIELEGEEKEEEKQEKRQDPSSTDKRRRPSDSRDDSPHKRRRYDSPPRRSRYSGSRSRSERYRS